MKDYEKLYKEALVNATREYESAQTESTRSVIKNIFPELTESNDERIWKEMLDFFCQFEDKTLRGVDISSWIAWLEKQKPSKMYVSGILYEHIRNSKACLVDMPESHKHSDYYSQAYYDLEEAMKLIKVGEKPVEWSEEDEKMVESCLLFVNANRTHPLATKCIDWLKSLKPNHWKPSAEQMKALKLASDKDWDIDGNSPLYTLYNDLKKL